MLDIAKAVDAFNSLGWAHNDIKPSNIGYIEENSVIKPKLFDFGLAQRETEIKASNRGTVAFMDPDKEVFSLTGKPLSHPSKFVNNKKADAWAMGLTFHSLLNKYSWPKYWH